MKSTVKVIIGLILATSIVVSSQVLARINVKCNDVYSCFSVDKQLMQRDKILESPRLYANLRYNSSSYDRDQVARSSISGLPKQISALGRRVFVFSPRLRKWAAYDSLGYRVAYGRANGGSGYCRDLGRPCLTPQGSFKVFRKGTIGCKSSKFPLPFGGAAMPYCMFFQGGNAIHGSPYVSNRNTSHGCIRVTTVAAKWLHRYFIQHGTRVLVLPY